MESAMSPGQWDRFDQLIRDIDAAGPHTAAQIKQVAVCKARDEDACVRRMVMAYYAISVDPIRSNEGRCIGNYRLGRLIGEGAMGAVYQGIELTIPHREVAVKLIHPRYSNARLRQLFLQQIDRYRHIDHHPYLAPLLSADIYIDPQTCEKIPYYVMPYIQGIMNLKRFARRIRMTEPERLILFKAVCSGVRHLHKNGIIHGDLKPSNILVDQEGHPYIIDFGLDDGQSSDFILSTLPGSKKLKSDIWIGECTDAGVDIRALGKILCELFGNRSSSAPTATSFLMRIGLKDMVRTDELRHVRICSSQSYRRQLERIHQKSISTPADEGAGKAYQNIDALVTDVDEVIKEMEAGSPLFESSFKKLLILLGIGVAIESWGHLSGSLYAKTGAWLLIHIGVALVIIDLFLVLMFQYLRYLAPILNRTLTIAYGTGFVASLVGGLLYAFGPPAHTDIATQLSPVWHIKLMRFMATGVVLPIFYSSFLAMGAAKRKDPSFKAAEWRVVSMLLLSLVVGTLIFTCVQLTEHPILSIFFGDLRQGDVRCEIFILVAWLCTLSLICCENWQTLSTPSGVDRPYVDASAFLSRLIAALVSVSLSGAILAVAYWGQGLTPNVHDGAFAALTIGLISVWSFSCCAIFTGNHVIVRRIEDCLAPHFKSRNLWVRVIYWFEIGFHRIGRMHRVHGKMSADGKER
jgi:serine/threonine protein kinase